MMHNFNKKIICAMLSGLICLITCGCSKSKEKDAIYVVMVNALNGHPVYEQQAEGARRAAKDYGITLDIIGPSIGTASVSADYVSAMENAVTLSPDAIICEPFEPSIYGCVSLAYNASIPVFCTADAPDNPKHYIAYSGTDNKQFGINAAELIAKDSGGKANILAVVTNLSVASQIEQLNGLKETIEKKYPDMKVVDTVPDDADMSKAVSVFQDNFNAYPEIDTVVMFEATGGPAAAKVAGEMNKKIRILDIDATAETIDNLISGKEWATQAQNFYKRGYETVRMAYEYITGNGKVEFKKFEDSSTVVINKENAFDYKKILWESVRTKGKNW